MKKTFSTIIVFFGLLILLNGVTTTTQAMEDASCKPEEERKNWEKTWCFQLKQIGRVCKLDKNCEKNERGEIEEEKDEEIEPSVEVDSGSATCAPLESTHLAAANTNLFQDPNDESKVISKIKKD